MSFFSRPLIEWTDRGLYCERGGFYIDPHRAVEVAVVTHAHSDHARRGSQRYICAASGAGLLKSRLGSKITVDEKNYGDPFQLGEVKVSLHPAGHILGSAQVRVEYANQVWVASGDYKRDADPSCEPFEVVACDTFITEATFGTPKFVWPKGMNHGQMISKWWDEASSKGKNCILFGYSLGKAQRILAELYEHAKKPILIHSAMVELTECYRKNGRKLAETFELEKALQNSGEGLLVGEMILAPPSVLKDIGLEKLGNFETAFASGWMQGASNQYGREYDQGFVISDHADWNDLNQTILETGARTVYVQHRNGALIRHLRKLGIDAHSSDVLSYEHFQRLGGENLRLF